MCTCPKPWPGFPTSQVIVFLCSVSSVKIKWLTMGFFKRETVSQSFHRRAKPLRWEMTEKRPRVLEKNHLLLFYSYDSMLIKNLVMWRHYNVILENSDITKRPRQRLAISDNWNHLSAYVIWNILVLNIKGKLNKIAIR